MAMETTNVAKSDFYNRFGIEIDAGEARRRFVNRVHRRLFNLAKEDEQLLDRLVASLPDLFGEENAPEDVFNDGWYYLLRHFVVNDYYKTLQVIERLCEIDTRPSCDANLVNEIIRESEASLGIRF